jgi:outer membrane protein TolC
MSLPVSPLRAGRVLALAALTACAAAPESGASRVGAWSLDAPQDAPPDAARPAARTPAAADELPSADAPVEAWVAYAERHSPGLSAARERWQAARQAVQEAGARPDPRLRIGVMLDHVQTRTGPMEGQYGIEQAFPWFGTLDAAEQRAAQEAEAVREEYEAARLLVSERVRRALHELAWLERALAVADGHRALVAQWEQVARSRYASGSAGQADVLRAQVELGKLEDRSQTLADLRGPFVARLNAALGRPAGAPVDPPSDPYPVPGAIDEAALRDGLPASSPALRARARAVLAADASIELADAAYYPDFALGLEYTSIGRASMPVDGSGDDALAVTLGIDLPLWRGRLDAGLARARAERSAAVASAADERLALGAELAMTLYELRDADRRLALFRDGLVAKGRQALAAVSAAYSAGEASLLELVDSQRELLEFELSAARAETDRGNALIHAESLTGVTLHEEVLP